MARPVILTDVTELVDGTGDPAFAVDTARLIVAWNSAAEDLLGYRAEEVLGRSCAQVICGRNGQGYIVCTSLCPLQRALRSGERVREMRLQVRRRDGVPLWVAMTSLVLPTEVPVVVHILRDITAERNQEAFLRQVMEGAAALVASPPSSPPPPPPPPPLLSPRETQILRLLASGYGTRAIAETLAISPATVRNHIQQIMMTLRAHSRLEAVVKALQRGLI
ncbi:MAG: LuxR C-terminal-related transcriptional regulator [Armatimonadota bacterium]|nr:LuxR C-terminal-related transcriptional regulator [Armatimonadota bacterium]